MRTILMTAALAALSGCADDRKAPRRAVADLDPRSGSTMTGHVVIEESDLGVNMSVKVAGGTPGEHGIHIHQVGDCSGPDAQSAGDHWNPTGFPHGGPRTSRHHAGDLGNIRVGPDGRGTLEIVLPGLSVAPGDMSVVGHSIVVHAAVDDLTSQPAGNSGSRVACGVVAVKMK